MTVDIRPDLDRLLDSAEMREDPYPIYRRLRREAPIGWSTTWNAWVVSRYDDVNDSLRDKDHLSNEDRQSLLFAAMSDAQREQLTTLRHYFAQKDVIGSDPPDHTRLRGLVQRSFTPKTIAALQQRIRTLAEELLRAAACLPRFDFVREIAHPLPVILIAEMLGASAADRDLFKRWSADILAFQGTGQASYEAALLSQASLVEMFAYMTDLIEDRRARPRDDLISVLANAELAGQRFARDELLATCNTLLTAGHETTTNLIGSLFRQLLGTPGRWRELQSEVSLIPGAIEETLRFDAPKQRNFRRVKRSHEFHGARFTEGQMVLQLIGSANRDEARFPDPDRFDMRRSPNDHLSFGAGIHFCLGATLARAEAKHVLEAAFSLTPRLRLVPDQVQTWQDRVQFRGPKELWVDCR